MGVGMHPTDEFLARLRTRPPQGFLPAVAGDGGAREVADQPGVRGTGGWGRCPQQFLPVLRFPVPTLAATDVRDSETMNEVLGSLNHCTWPMNYLGLPGLSVPAGFSKSGLPVGFQLVGRPFAEAMLFRMAGRLADDQGRRNIVAGAVGERVCSRVVHDDVSHVVPTVPPP